MSKTVTRGSWGEQGLYSQDGSRKYLNREERRRYLRAAETLPADRNLFALVLAWTGARISEVLNLTAASFQLDASLVTLVTLKRRKFIVREIPIPPPLMARLNRHFGLRRLQCTRQPNRDRIWTFCRQTAWRFIKRVMSAARIAGRQACARGVRHSFGVATLQSGMQLNVIQKWMGHARMSTTAIYASVCGPEEFALARQFWRSEGVRTPSPWL